MLGHLNRRAFLAAIAALPLAGKLVPKGWQHAGPSSFEQAERLVKTRLSEGMRGIPSKRSISVVAQMSGVYTPPITAPVATVTAIHTTGGVRVLRFRAFEDPAGPICVGHCFELGPDGYASASIEL